MAAGAIGLRRAYDPPGEGEGWRVLVDRLWQRGAARAGIGDASSETGGVSNSGDGGVAGAAVAAIGLQRLNASRLERDDFTLKRIRHF